MKLDEVMSTLKKAGKPNTAKIYQRHGSGPNVYGVSFADLGKLTKKIKKDHGLALELWSTGVGEAQTLALMIADPAQLKDDLADAWVADSTNRGLRHYLACLVARSPIATKKMKEWMKAKDEARRSTGYAILAFLMRDTPAMLADGDLEKHLATIEKEIHGSPNWARYSMLMGLISIGLRPSLQKKAIQAARRIGKVDVDMGETSCKIPDAEEYILKASKRLC